MNKIEILKEGCPYIILAIIIASFKFAYIDFNLYKFWQPIIDDLILLVFLFFIFLNSKNWNWFSKRILYSLIFILFLNTYTKLFGLPTEIYSHWYLIPLLSVTYSLTISITIETTYKLYKLWKDGKIKFY